MWLVVLGGGALLFFLTRGKGEGKGPPPGVPPQQEQALLVMSGDQLAYRPEARGLILQRLRTLSPKGPIPLAAVTEKDAKGLADPFLYELIDRGHIVPPGKQAYESARGLHAMGRNVWVSPTMMSPTPQKRFLYSTDPEVDADPPNSLQGRVALLVSFKDTWPALGGESLPTPRPNEAPKPPPTANA